MVSKYYHSLPSVSSVSIASAMRDGQGSAMGDVGSDGYGGMHYGGGVGLLEGLANYGLAGGNRGGGVSSNAVGTVTGSQAMSTVTGSQAMGTVTGSQTMSTVGNGGYEVTVANDLLSEDRGNTGGGTIELSFLGLDGIDRLPRVVFSGVDSLALDLRSLVVVFTGSINGSTGVVAGINMGFDGGTSDVTWGDGG